MKTHNINYEKTGKYRQFFVRTLHSAFEFLSDTKEQVATDILVFIREAIQKFPHSSSLTTEKSSETFPLVR